MGFIARLQEQGKLPPLPDESRGLFADASSSEVKRGWEARRRDEGRTQRTVWLSNETNARLEVYMARHSQLLSTAVDELLAAALDAEERRD